MKNIQQKLLTTFFAFLVYSLASAQTNVTTSGMSIQGIARDENNSALANFDQLELVFAVYYLGEGNSEESILTKTANVTTDNFGVFSYVLDIDQQQYNLISNNSAYLKVTQGSVVFSNEKLQAVPYAIHAQNGVPTGSIMPFVGTEAPNGWLLCDGSTFTDDTYHANLKALLGSNKTPNLQGMFLRGAGTWNNDHKGPDLMDFQGDAIEEHFHELGSNGGTSTNGDHSHNFTYRWERRGIKDGGAHAMDKAVTSGGYSSVNYGTTTEGAHSHTLTGRTNYFGTTETRPANYGVNYIIKI